MAKEDSNVWFLLKVRIKAVLPLIVAFGLAGCGVQTSAPPSNRDDDSAAARSSEHHESRKEERREERREEKNEERREGERDRSDRPPSSMAASSDAGGDRYDLERDEQRGGHTLTKHVGRTDDQLRERLDRERNISAASTWTDLPTAETTVAAALRTNQNRIAQWEQRGYPRANLALHFDAGHVVGRSLTHGADQAVNVSQAVVVLKADGPNSFFVLTTYPEEGR